MLLQRLIAWAAPHLSYLLWLNTRSPPQKEEDLTHPYRPKHSLDQWSFSISASCCICGLWHNGIEWEELYKFHNLAKQYVHLHNQCFTIYSHQWLEGNSREVTSDVKITALVTYPWMNIYINFSCLRSQYLLVCHGDVVNWHCLWESVEAGRDRERVGSHIMETDPVPNTQLR